MPLQPEGGSPYVKYFVDPDTHWDIAGYWEQLRSLEPRLSRPAFGILSRTSFHDAELLEIKVNNLSTWGRPRRMDPTEVVVRLWHPNEYVYALTYSGVTSINFGFSGRTSACSGADRRGVDDWLYDELTRYDDTYLSHEVEFASGAVLLLLFRRIACSRSTAKRRYI